MRDELLIARQIVSGIPEAAILLDSDLKPVASNDAYASLSGLRRLALRKRLESGVSVFETVGCDPESDAKNARESIKSGSAIRLAQVEIHSADGVSFTRTVTFIAGGFTGRDGAMVFGNFTGFSDNPLTDEEFHDKPDAALDKTGVDVKTKLFRFRSEWVEPVTLEDTRYGSHTSEAQPRGDVLRGPGRIDSLREQAQAILSRYAEGGATEAKGQVAFSLKDTSPVIEVYALAGDKVAGLATYDPLARVWSVWNAPPGQDIRDGQITPVSFATTTDALAALRRPGVRLVRRRASPYNPGGNQPGDFGVEVDTEPSGEGNAFTRAMDAMVGVANRLLATDWSGSAIRMAAIRMAQDESPDLIILDVMMPELDGIEACNRLRASFTTRHIPVIMVTARAHRDDKLNGLAKGANDYVTKPFHF